VPIFGRNRREGEPSGGERPEGQLREVLYGDVPLIEWRSASTDDVSQRFQAAAAAQQEGSVEGAVSILQSLVADADLESRDHLEAWTALRGMGVRPSPEDEARVLGVVLDVPMAGGLDTLAAYADASARYVNHTGKIAVVEALVGGLTPPILALVAEGQKLAPRIGPWVGRRPPLLAGAARISMLCPGGLYFGQGPRDVLMSDPMAAPVFTCGAELIQAITRLST